MSVDFGLRNYGHSAAQHVQIFPEFIISSDETRHNPACKKTYPPNDLGYVVLPTELLQTTYAMNIQASAILEDRRKHPRPPEDRNIFMEVIGCVVYSDGVSNGQLHHTPFSYGLELRDGSYITLDKMVISPQLMDLRKMIIDRGTAD